MAQQVKFYSVAASDTKPTAGNGIIFVDNGELYKGTQRFGANKVTLQETPPTFAQGAIAGDINIYNEHVTVFDGSLWRDIIDVHDLGIDTKAEAGSSATEAQHGISAGVVLSASDNPSLSMTVGAVTTAAGITSTSDYFTTGSAIYDYANGLISGTTGSYIESISKDANGKLTANAKAFPTLNLDSNTEGGNDCGVYVSVTTQSGAVTSVEVSADNLNVSSITAVSGSFTNLTVTDTATFSATTVSATTLTVGGVDVSNIATATSTSTANGITVGVTTANGGVTAVTLDATSFGNVMHFVGVASVSSSVPESPDDGDIIVIGAATSEALPEIKLALGVANDVAQGQEYIYNGSSWELIGDQNTYAIESVVSASVTALQSRATDLETSMSTRASVGTGTATASYGVSGEVVLAANAQPTLSISVAPVTTSAGITDQATDSLATAAAIKGYVDGAIGAIEFSVPTNSTAGDSDKGVQVSVTTEEGVVTAVDVVTTLQTTIATTNTDDEIPSAKAVSNALCWYKANGTEQW